MERFSHQAWFPHGLATGIELLEEGPVFSRYALHTPHGTLSLHAVEDLLTSAGWNSLLAAAADAEDHRLWGEAQAMVGGEVELLEGYVTQHGVEAILKHSNNSFVALFDPLAKSSWRRRWSQVEGLEGALKCSGGVQHAGRDLLLLRPLIEDERCLLAADIDVAMIARIGAALGRFHTSIAGKAGPRMAKQWNDRLKRLERISGSLTMWRAPHSESTESIWSITKMDFGDWTLTDSGVYLDTLRIGCERLGDLIDETVRFPALRDVALLHCRIDEIAAGQQAAALHTALFEAWSSAAPGRWTSSAALDSNRGGALIWRYDVELSRLLEAQIERDVPQSNVDWLSEVTAIQRRSFNRRVIPALGLSALIIAAFCAMFLDIPALSRLALLVGGVLSRILAQVAYRRTASPPY